jgi:hypothetical protein
MTMSTKVELLRAALTRYLKADKQAKTKILDELSANIGLHRKTRTSYPSKRWPHS